MTSMPVTEPVEAPAWSIRPEQPIDLDQIHDLHRAAFRGPAEAELVDAVRSGPDFLPELSLVAASGDGSVLGHLLISRIGLDALEPEAPRRDALALAPMAVLPAHWNRGIGSALVRAALEIVDTRSEPFVAVLGSAGYYGRFGFEPAARYGIDGPYADAGDAFQIRLAPGQPPVTAGTLIYPPMFDGI